jgi:hypothetical protein
VPTKKDGIELVLEQWKRMEAVNGMLALMRDGGVLFAANSNHFGYRFDFSFRDGLVWVQRNAMNEKFRLIRPTANELAKRSHQDGSVRAIILALADFIIWRERLAIGKPALAGHYHHVQHWGGLAENKRVVHQYAWQNGISLAPPPEIVE